MLIKLRPTLLVLFGLVLLVGCSETSEEPIEPIDPIENNPPTISTFTATQNADGLNVSFAWDVRDSDGDQVTCTLDVDDDGTVDYTIDDCEMGEQVHTYAAAGDYTAILTATDGNDASARATVTTTVEGGRCLEPERLTDFGETRIENEVVLENRSEPMDCVDYIVDVDPFPRIYQVRDAGVLTIEPGVVMAFEDGEFFEVTGELRAVGTADLPIVLTAVNPEAGAWAGLALRNGDGQLEHVTIEYAGSRDVTSSNYDAPANLTVRDDSTLRLVSCTLRRGAGYGMFSDDDASLMVIDNSTFTENALGAAATDTPNAYAFDADNTYTGNDVDAVFVNPRYGGVAGEVTWEAIDVPFVVTRELSTPALSVSGDASLTLAPGTTVHMAENVAIDVRDGGRLVSRGTMQNQVVVRNIPGEANFAGIVIYDALGEFAYTTIQNGGSRELGYDDVNTNVLLTSFTGTDDRVGRATFGEGMQQSGAPYGLAFDNWGGSTGTTAASGVGCSAMTPIYYPDSDDTAGQCN